MSELDDIFKATEQRMQKASIRRATISRRSARAAHRPPCSTASTSKRTARRCRSSKSPPSARPDARTLQITAFDRNTVGAIRKAIETSDLGLNPNIDGSTLRLQIPPLTEDRRKDLVKVIKKKAEDGKVAVRNIRHKSVDEVKALLKDGTITEDENKRAAERIQKSTDKFIKDVDGLVAR